MAINYTEIKELLAQIGDDDSLIEAMTDRVAYEALSTAGRLLVDIVNNYNTEHADDGSSFRLALVLCTEFDGTARTQWWAVNLMDGDVIVVRISAETIG